MPGAQGQITVRRQRNGNGIRDVSSFFALSTSRMGVTIANTSGWTTNLLQPTMDKPYLWRYLRTTYTAQSDTYTTPELVATYLSGVHPNLLVQTDFKQISLMNRWDKKSLYTCQPGQTAFDAIQQHIVTGVEGNNAYFDSTEDKRISVIQYKEVLRQVVHGPGHLFLNKDTWYTLSFWAKGTSFITYIYGSQTHIDITAGQYVDGLFFSSIAVDANHDWVHSDSNTWTKHTFSFKTANVEPTDTIMFLVRITPLASGSNTVTICMPKLEIGMLDTGYCLSVSDNIGLSGPAVRNFENGMVSGQKYYCNDPSINTIDSEVFDVDGIRHVDFITFLDDTAGVDATGYAVYQCIRNYTASANVTSKSVFAAISGISAYFQEVTTTAKAAFFTYLLAKNAYIKFLSGTQMVAQNANGDVVGGMQGDPTKPIFWAGGSTPSTAPFRVGFDGRVVATSGEFRGSIATPPSRVISDDQDTLYINLSTGFNFAGKLSGDNTMKWIYLPSGTGVSNTQYDGVECSILNLSDTTPRCFYIKNTANEDFLYSCNPLNRNSFNRIYLYGIGELRLKAIVMKDANNNDHLYWFVQNYNDFSFDYYHNALNNLLPSSITRCIGTYKLTTTTVLQNIGCSDYNILTLTRRNTGRWTFTFPKTRSSKRTYSVLINGDTNIYIPYVHDITTSSFQVDLVYYLGGTPNYGDIANWGFMIIENEVAQVEFSL